MLMIVVLLNDGQKNLVSAVKRKSMMEYQTNREDFSKDYEWLYMYSIYIS